MLTSRNIPLTNMKEESTLWLCCAFNSILQALHHNDLIDTTAVLSPDSHRLTVLTHEAARHMKAGHLAEDVHVNLIAAWRDAQAPTLTTDRQHDANEVLSYLLKVISDDGIFRGNIEKEIKTVCTKCGHNTSGTEASKEKAQYYMIGRDSVKAGMINIEDAMNNNRSVHV